MNSKNTQNLRKRGAHSTRGGAAVVKLATHRRAGLRPFTEPSRAFRRAYRTGAGVKLRQGNEASMTEQQASAQSDTAADAGTNGDGDEGMVPQARVNSLLRAERESAESRGASNRETALLQEFSVDSLDELREGWSEYQTAAEQVATDADRQNQRVTRLERNNQNLTAERDQWQGRFFNAQRSNALGNELLALGINPARAGVAIRSAQDRFDELEVDETTFKVTGAKELARAVKKESPEWFPDAATSGAPDANRNAQVDNTPVTPGVGRLTRFFGSP